MSFRRMVTAGGCLTAVLLSCGGPAIPAKDQERLDRQHEMLEEAVQKTGSVSWMNASAPIGRFLLIRAGDHICAIRFVEFHRGRDARRPTPFNSGDESTEAFYDWIAPSAGTQEFVGSTVKSGNDKVDEGPVVGLGLAPFFWPKGNRVLECGPFRLEWGYPNGVSFKGKLKDGGEVQVELAPTGWSEPREINVNDARLRWFRLDQSRPSMSIPLSDLPGGSQ